MRDAIIVSEKEIQHQLNHQKSIETIKKKVVGMKIWQKE